MPKCPFCARKLGKVYYKLEKLSFCPSCHNILIFLKNEMMAQNGNTMRRIFTHLYDNTELYDLPITKIVKK